ncbi:MAG: UvrD-helicase domain-containing protein [Nannocystaceae bacterium]
MSEASEKQEPVIDDLSQEACPIVMEECQILTKIHARLRRDADVAPQKIENLDAQLIELRDAIGEAKEEDIASLVDQMHQVAALSRTRGQGRDIPIDPKNPYFGHLQLKESRSAEPRDVLIGKHTMLDDGDGLSIVDWRNAPVSRLYYRYEEGDEYEEEFDDRSLEGVIHTRRSLAIMDHQLRRVSAPQGTFVANRSGRWREAVGSSRPTLEGGVGTAARVPRGQLGIHGDDDQPRADKHLQEITALIDKQQFGLITQPESGIVLIQGGAGSGKTTVALHRVAYLSYNDHRRFAPKNMLIVVFNDALVEYIRHVLPSLGVDGVQVTTYRRWSDALLRRFKLRLPIDHVETTPEVVSRFKKHPVILRMIEALITDQLRDAVNTLERRLSDRQGYDTVVEIWQELQRLPPVVRVRRARDAVKQARGKIPPATRTLADTALRSIESGLRDLSGDWIELMSDGEAIRAAIHEHAKDAFRDNEVEAIIRWCATKAELEDQDIEDEAEMLEDLDPDERKQRRIEIRIRKQEAKNRGVGLDPEDDAILMRLCQLKNGGIFFSGRRFEYEHVVIDEAQDLCPLEVRVLLDCVSEGKSVTIAGDRAQKMIFDNGFRDWPELLADAGLPHVAIQPLKITYRSTRQVMDLSRHILGPLAREEDHVIARDGAQVGFYGFGDIGESVAFLADSLRNLMQREPTASVALISRYPQQAKLYYDALRIAEVPRLRLVARQNFVFAPGIDVTDVRQIKGLEFDYVVVLDPTNQNYPEVVESRHLLHIAVTRAAHQLWMVCTGKPSKLVPEQLIVESVN